MRAATLTVVVTMFIGLGLAAQSRDDKMYFNEWGEVTTSKDSSLYYRLWLRDKQMYDDENSFYTLTNKLRAFEPRSEGYLHGEMIRYHENGQLYFRLNYLKGYPYGDFKTFYPNGRPHMVQSYDSAKSISLKLNKKIGVVILHYYDSAGNQLVKDGEGEMIEYNKRKLGYWMSRGLIKSGVKDSTWSSFYPNGKTYYQEEWQLGEFLKGTSYNENGEATEYSELETQAAPTVGMTSFYSFIGKSLKYPSTAKKLNVEGKVFVEFVIEKDGTLTHVKVLKGIGAGCDEEAVRVVSQSPQWKPGLQRGQPVRTRFNLPVIFKLK